MQTDGGASKYVLLFVTLSPNRLSGSIIIHMAYGLELQEDDPYISWSEEALEGLTQTFVTGFAVDVLPWMRYIPECFLPGGGFHKLARQWNVPTRNILNSPWMRMKQNYVSILPHIASYLIIHPPQTKGTAQPSFCRDLLDANGGLRCDPETEDTIKRTSATLYAGKFLLASRYSWSLLGIQPVSIPPALLYLLFSWL